MAFREVIPASCLFPALFSALFIGWIHAIIVVIYDYPPALGQPTANSQQRSYHVLACAKIKPGIRRAVTLKADNFIFSIK